MSPTSCHDCHHELQSARMNFFSKSLPRNQSLGESKFYRPETLKKVLWRGFHFFVDGVVRSFGFVVRVGEGRSTVQSSVRMQQGKSLVEKPSSAIEARISVERAIEDVSDAIV